MVVNCLHLAMLGPVKSYWKLILWKHLQKDTLMKFYHLHNIIFKVIRIEILDKMSQS